VPSVAPVVPAPVPAEALLPAQPAEPDPLAHIYQEPVLTSPMDEAEAADNHFSLQQQAHDAEGAIRLHEDEEPKRSHPVRKFLSYFVALIAVAILVASGFFIHRNRPYIPSEIRRKADYTLYDLVPNDNFKLDVKSVEYASAGNLVFFVDNPHTKAHFVISEQKIPDVVKNEADYQQFLAEYDKYAEFDSKIGKAYFTRPANIGSDISVVVKTNTTLIFIRGPGTTTDEDWTKLIGYMRVVQ
jgi:hypothetical protein